MRTRPIRSACGLVCAALSVINAPSSNAAPRKYSVTAELLLPQDQDNIWLPAVTLEIVYFEGLPNRPINATQPIHLNALLDSESVRYGPVSHEKATLAGFAGVILDFDNPMFRLEEERPLVSEFGPALRINIRVHLKAVAGGYNNYIDNSLSRIREYVSSGAATNEQLQWAIRFMDWYHRQNHRGNMDLADSLHDHAMLYPILLKHGNFGGTDYANSVINIDLFPGFRQLMARQRWWTYARIADSLSSLPAGMDLQAGGLTVYDATIYFYELSMSAASELAVLSDKYIPKHVQQKYLYQLENDEALAAADTILAYLQKEPRLVASTANAFLGAWLDMLYTESGYGILTPTALVERAAREDRLCHHWTAFARAAAYYSYARTRLRHQHIGGGADVAEAIEAKCRPPVTSSTVQEPFSGQSIRSPL